MAMVSVDEVATLLPRSLLKQLVRHGFITAQGNMIESSSLTSLLRNVRTFDAGGIERMSAAQFARLLGIPARAVESAYYRNIPQCEREGYLIHVNDAIGILRRAIQRGQNEGDIIAMGSY